MKKWPFALAGAVIAIIAVAGVAFALTGSGNDDDDGSRASRPSDENDGGDTGDSGLAICIEGVIECDDTIDEPSDGVCPDIYPPPAGCGDPDEPVSTAPPLLDDQPASGCASANSLQSCEEAAISLATEELASRLGSADGIKLVSIEFVEWRDACLGIYKPDVACAEVFTPGFRIVLEANGQTFEYHTDVGTRAELVE